ncbi:MAG: KH domain-containing protein [Acidobacteriota bacterium]|nr:KH domain-containing protein [Acidobacteriota bacterium]
MSESPDTRAIQFLKDIASAMGVTVDVAVEESTDNVRLNMHGAGAEVLIQRKGETLDALQHIVNTAFRRDTRGQAGAQPERHYVVDAIGFRKDKEAELRQMAKFLMEKAKMSGAAQEIGPLNPYHRRIVHMTVSETPGFTSESAGDAFMKSIYISATK